MNKTPAEVPVTSQQTLTTTQDMIITPSTMVVTCSSATTATTTSVVFSTSASSTPLAIPKSPLEDPRVSWIHEMQKHQLVAEMAKHNLPTEGTVAELRRIFCDYWRAVPPPVSRELGPSTTTSQSVLPTHTQPHCFQEVTHVLSRPVTTTQYDASIFQPVGTMATGGLFYQPPATSYVGGAESRPMVTGPVNAWNVQTPAYQVTNTYQPGGIIPPGAMSSTNTAGLLGSARVSYYRPATMGLPMASAFESKLLSSDDAIPLRQRLPRQELRPDFPFVDELSSVRELLGLSPNADSDCVQRTLATLVQSSRGSDYNQPRNNTEPVYNQNMLQIPRTTSQYATYRPVAVTHEGVEPTGVLKTSQTLCDMVRKWNLRFDGRRDAVSFLERLEELREAYSLSPEEVLKAMPELFSGQALLWFRNNKDLWSSFAEFRRLFEAQFFPPGYHRNLDEEIRKRTQGECEPFRDFVIALTTLIRRSGTYSNQQKIDLVYTNMRPDYKFMIQRQDFSTLAELLERAEEYEEVVRERKNFRPPPPVSQALMPETAYVPRRKNDRTMDTAIIEHPLPEPFSADPSPSVSNANVPIHASSSGRVEAQSQTRRVSFDDKTGQRRNWNRSPSPQNVPRNSSSPTRQAARKVRQVICWNCNAEGHLYRQCQRPKKMRCFNCKREGVATTRCGCRSVNYRRTQALGGHLSPQSTSEAQPPTTGRNGSSS